MTSVLTATQLTRLAALSEGEGSVLGNVVVTATLDDTGVLSPVMGVREKLLGAIRDEHVPRIGAFAVAAQQDLLTEPGMAEHRRDSASPRLLGCGDFGELVDALAGLRHRRPGVAPVDYHHVLRQTYRSSEFTGRKWLFERIEDAFKARDRGFIVVCAGPGFGKTAMALQLIERWRESRVGDVALGAWHILRKTEATWWPARQLVEQLEWRLRDRLACPLGAGAEKVDERNAAQLLKQALIDAAAQAKKAGQRLVLVVDGVDEAFGTNATAQAVEQQLLLHELFPGPQNLPEGVFVLFTSRPGSHLTSWLNDDAVIIDVDRDEAAKRDNETDLHVYLQTQLTAVADPGGYAPQRTSELAQRMVQACEGAFFVAEWLARKVEEERALFERWLDGEKLPRGIDGVLRADWKHKLSSLRSDVQRRVFPVLAATIAIWHEAGTKVTAEVIEELFTRARGSDLDVGDLQADEIRGPAVRGVLAKLRDWFDAGAGESDPVYTFRHSRIPELILEREVEPPDMLVDKRTQLEVHRLLAWTSSRWSELPRGSASRKVALANAPWHFALAGILGSALKEDPMDGGAMRLLAHWLEPEPYLQVVYKELDNAASILSRNYTAAIALAAREEDKPPTFDGSQKPDPLKDRLLHLRDVWRVLSEHGQLLRDPSCPLVPSMYNQLAAAWAEQSQAHRDLVQTAEAYTGTWLQWMNPDPPDRRLIVVLRGHTDQVECLAMSPDGTRLASGSRDSTVRLWDPQTGAPVGEPLTGHTRVISCLAWSPDGTRLASGSGDNTVRLWEPHTGAPVGEPLTGHTHPISCLAWSPDGRRLASGSSDSTLRLWDPHTGAPVGEPLTGHTRPIIRLAWSPDGTLLASGSGSGDSTVRLWDPHTRAPVGEPLTGHTKWISCLAWSPDGTRLASSSGDSTVRLWDPHTGAPVGEPLSGHARQIICLAWSPNGTRLASGSSDSTLRLWDPQTGAPVGEPLTGHTEWIRCLAWSPDGRRLASGSKDSTVRLWDPHTRAPVDEPLTALTKSIDCLAWSPDGTRLASGSEDSSVRLWDPHTGAPVGEPLTGHTKWIICLSWSPDGTRLASGSGDSTVRLWDPQTGAPVGEPLTGHTCPINCLAWSPDGTRLASGTGDSTVRLWDPNTGASVGEPLTGHTRPIICLAWSPDGTLLASGSGDSTLRLWDPNTGASVGEPLTGHTRPIICLAWSPDGTLLASGSEDSTLRLWDPHTGAPVGEPLTGHTEGIRCLAWSPDGTRLASGSNDKTLRLWGAQTGSRVAIVQGRVGVSEILISCNGYHVACTCAGAVHISRYRLQESR